MPGSGGKQFSEIFNKARDGKVEPLQVVSRNDTPTDEEGVDDLGSFGWLRGIREHAIMLELRKKGGNSLAVDYGGMEIEYDPSVGITLHLLSGRKVHIKGKNLNAEVEKGKRLYEGLTRHRVPWVTVTQEEVRLQAGRDVMVIDSIEW